MTSSKKTVSDCDEEIANFTYLTYVRNVGGPSSTTVSPPLFGFLMDSHGSSIIVNRNTKNKKSTNPNKPNNQCTSISNTNVCLTNFHDILISEYSPNTNFRVKVAVKVVFSGVRADTTKTLFGPRA